MSRIDYLLPQSDPSPPPSSQNLQAINELIVKAVLIGDIYPRTCCSSDVPICKSSSFVHHPTAHAAFAAGELRELQQQSRAPVGFVTVASPRSPLHTNALVTGRGSHAWPCILHLTQCSASAAKACWFGNTDDNAVNEYVAK